MSKNENAVLNTIVTQAIAPADRMIPKLCTNIGVELINNKYVVLSMFYMDNTQQASLIDRVTIDVEHAKKLAEIFNEVVEKAS